MGRNFLLNIADHGYAVAGYDKEGSQVDALAKEKNGQEIYSANKIEDFLDSLRTPRAILMLVPAGKAVDSVIDDLQGHLEPGDVLIDAGNSYFKDTNLRAKRLSKKGIHYLGVGVSGGEEGARHGPSIMPGGPKEAYERVRPLLEAAASHVDGKPCVAHLGPGSSGHFVKMVHNGIEYGDMQLIAEVYDLLRTALGMEAQELADVFTEWNQGVLSSYLIEITSKIFARKDHETGKPLVDLILDKAGQKGTGKWTTQIALDLGVATPTINAAVEARILSSIKDERVMASKKIRGPKAVYRGDREKLIAAAHEALFASKICSYAQGMAMIRAASEEYNWKLDYSEIARIWRGGCIIRAQFLDHIREAFRKKKKLTNLLLDPQFKRWVRKAQPKWRFALQTANKLGVPTLAMSASMAYFDSYRRESLPQNLTQAQRDFFGAHTYERVDREGVFHTQWGESE
ncbi:MAG: NADP-dependent phosphogluconate dehydrogenase [Candidatus Omnitrophica bacterium]|nr:NADP-dependent phosphogluconate dehydrogenase [Candidatus Omnitrophota bacterium]